MEGLGTWLLCTQGEVSPDCAGEVSCTEQDEDGTCQAEGGKSRKRHEYKRSGVDGRPKECLRLAFGGIDVVDANVEGEYAYDPDPYLGGLRHPEHSQNDIWHEGEPDAEDKKIDAEGFDAERGFGHCSLQ